MTSAPMHRSSFFITFEGGEGAGKSTLITRLDAELRKQGYETIVSREPGGTFLGEHIRQLLLKQDAAIKIGAHAEVLLFLAARAQHLDDVIKPALGHGKIVLCDRFNDSTIAYQGYARGLGEKFVEDLCNWVCGPVKPDLTFYLDVDPKMGLDRAMRQQRVMDRMETEESAFHEKVRQGFLKIAAREKGRIMILDASATQDQVFVQAVSVLNKKLTG